MTKLTESSESKAALPKKGGWPLLIGVWALVETVASGWGVGAAFLAYHLSVSSLDKDRLAILSDPEKARRLGAYRAHQMLYSTSFWYFVPFIFYIIVVCLIKFLAPNFLTDLSRMPFLAKFIRSLCIYTNYERCPDSISFLYITASIIFSLGILFMFFIIRKEIIAINIKSYLFRYAYGKWETTVFIAVFVPLFIYLLFLYNKEFISLIISLCVPGNAEFGAYIQGSLGLIFIPIFLYLVKLYLQSTYIFISLIIKSKNKIDSDWIELFNQVLTSQNLEEIKNNFLAFNKTTMTSSTSTLSSS